MQFVTHGPDIPDALLQAHEEGRVVFFCGAGISYPAGLPGFKGLVERIYELNGTKCTDIEREAFKRGQFDATLNLLERRLPGQRVAVEQRLCGVLAGAVAAVDQGMLRDLGGLDGRTGHGMPHNDGVHIAVHGADGVLPCLALGLGGGGGAA